MNKKQLVIVATVFGFSANVFAFDTTKVPEIKRTTIGKYLDAKEAYEMASKEKVLFLDIRTRSEVNFLGMPTMADANVPYVEIDKLYTWDEKRNVFKTEPNSGFVSEVQKRLEQKGLEGKNAPIVLICRSGDRSAKAADLMAKAGYTNVYSVVDGYEGDVAKEGADKGKRVVNGWKNSNLPWSYSLAKDKMFFE
jgi:rhodanese-related sulfurtransferase